MASSVLKRWDMGLDAGRTLHFDGEVSRKAAKMNADGLVLTALRGMQVIARCDLTLVGKSQILFGSSPECDVVIAAEGDAVAGVSGAFVVKGGACTIVDLGSTDGLYVNGVKRMHSRFTPDDVVWVGRRDSGGGEGVVFLLAYDASPWRYYEFGKLRRVSFGRADDNDIALPSPVVSAHHAVMSKGLDGCWHIDDPGSYNGTFVNAAPVIGSVPLRSGDLVTIADTRIVYLGDFIVISCPAASI